jgi:hypothetical protein
MSLSVLQAGVREREGILSIESSRSKAMTRGRHNNFGNNEECPGHPRFPTALDKEHIECEMSVQKRTK